MGTGMNERMKRTQDAWRTTIAGGFVPIQTWELAAVWAAYSGGKLMALDIRVWLATHEMAGRRRAAGAETGRKPAFGVEELRGLVGRGQKDQSLRSSLRRLEALGLVRARKTGITFAKTLHELGSWDLEPVQAMLALLPGKRTWFPLPRPMLRVLCAGVKRAVFATVLGQCLWCLYRSGNAWREEGRVKASRLAQAFKLSTKSIYRAREHLVEIGWLACVDGLPAWRTKRHGAMLAVNLAWQREDAKRRLSTDRQLPTGKKSTRLHQAPSSKGSNNQEPAQVADRQSGSCIENKKNKKPPTWRDIQRADLENSLRRMRLYESAVAAGALPASEASLLSFLGACERARHRGSANPCGLLRWLVERNKCVFVTNDEEDAARRELREFRESQWEELVARHTFDVHVKALQVSQSLLPQMGDFPSQVVVGSPRSLGSSRFIVRARVGPMMQPGRRRTMYIEP